MIRYDLICDRRHEFDSWFQSAGAFDKVLAAGMVACPDCGSTEVSKALMAPGLRTSETAAETRKAARAEREKALAELKKKVEETSEYVGLRFAAEARAIHEGEAPDRSIYGEARVDEARKLLEDGVPVAPLPFLPNRRAN